MNEEEDLKPPRNFAMVTNGIFRGGFPTQENLSFLRARKIKSVLTLVPEEMPEHLLAFYIENNIHFYQFGVPGNKEPFVDIPDERIADALKVVVDSHNHPIYIHCNKGKHRTGCLIGCLRRMMHWSCTAVFEEYRRFANPKPRALDQQFIELFDLSLVANDK